MSHQRISALRLAVACGRLVTGLPAHNMASILDSLLRNARSYQRLSELSCNQELTKRENARALSLEKTMREQAASLGLGITFSGDPRGFVLKLQFPDGASNTWGQDGWGIG